MRPIFTPSFVRDYQRLPQHLQRRFDRALEFLLAKLRHPSLQASKMEGQRAPEGRDIWEARVTEGYRSTFVIDGNTYILRHVGPHDTLRHP